MASWAEFEAAEPELAAAGRKLLYQFGPGLAFLATVRRDGGPRLHPICPVVTDGALYAFIADTPKRRDLVRDGRYALHTFPPAEVDDEFYITGRAAPVSDPKRRDAAAAVYDAQGTVRGEDDRLFEFSIERVLYAAYGPRPAEKALSYTKWKAP